MATDTPSTAAHRTERRRHPLAALHTPRGTTWGATGCLLLIASIPVFGQNTAEPSDAEPTAPPPNHVTATDIQITERGTLNLHVSNQPLSVVLRMLSLKGQRNIIASPGVKGTVTANLYNATFEEVLEAILVANDAGYRRVGSVIYVHTRKELDDIAASSGDRPVTRVFGLNYITAEDATVYLSSVLGDKAVIATSPAAAKGLDSQANDGGGASHAAGDFVIITAPIHLQDQAEALLRQLDIRPKQILIESTILRARLNDDNALGIDFTLVGGVDLELLGSTSDGILNIETGQLPQTRYEQFNSAAQTDFRSNVPDGGLSIGIIKDQVAVFVRALEEVTDTVVVANPKVLTLNKQKGQVIVGRRDGYLTTTVTETQAIQTVEFLETGTTLIFRPFASDDGYVRVELHPEDSVGFVSAQGLPSEQTTEVTTNVIVKDGETILIGGLFREVTNDSQSQIAGLGSLPLLGPLFRSKVESSQREEVIILLTIHVVKDDQRFADASREAFEAVEKMRVGQRMGLMWTGRERLAQHHYRKALEDYSEGDVDGALWHTRLATHNNPRMVPAIDLRERISGKRAWDEDGTGGREFIYRLIARERGYPVQPFGRPEITGPSEPPTPNDDGQPLKAP